MNAKSLVPLRALILWTIMVPSAFWLALVLGSWVLPSILALDRDGLNGLRAIPVDWYGTAHAPPWVDRESDFWSRNVVDILGGFLGIALAAILGVLLHRLWTFLVVKKLHWMTKEDVERFNNKRQYM